MKLLQLGKGVYQYYINNVKGNEYLGNSQVQRKLTRNVMLSKQINLDEDHVLCLYGNLHMIVIGDTIVSISNHKAKCDWFKREKNMDDYKKYSSMFNVK